MRRFFSTAQNDAIGLRWGARAEDLNEKLQRLIGLERTRRLQKNGANPLKLSKNAVRDERVPKSVSSKNYTDFFLNKLRESCMKVELKISMLPVG